MSVRKRIEDLHVDYGVKRKRGYDKKDQQYWEKDKAAKHAAKRQRIEQEEAALTIQEDIENISPGDIRKKLRDLGYTTKVRKPEVLRKMLKDAMKEAGNC